MSMAAAAVVGGAALNYMSQQNAAGAQDSANRQNMALNKEQLAAQKREFDINTLTGEQRYNDMYGGGGISQSMRDYAGQNLGGYQQGGQAANQQMQSLMGLNGAEAGKAAMANFNESPGQAFLRERGQKALLSSASATGGLRGGRVQTALQEQGIGFAQQDYGNYMNRLSGLSGQGLQAGGQMVAKDQGVLGGGGPTLAGGASGRPDGSTSANRGSVLENYGADERAKLAAQEKAKFEQDLRAGEGFQAKYAQAQAEAERKLKERKRFAGYDPTTGIANV